MFESLNFGFGSTPLWKKTFFFLGWGIQIVKFSRGGFLKRVFAFCVASGFGF